MKTLLMVVAVALLPLNLALATPLTEAGPAGIHPAQLSLPGEVIDLQPAGAQQVQQEVAKGDERLHPSQLSLEGEVIEDVLAPSTGLEDH